MKIDVHSHQIEEIFFDALRALPGVTIKTNPDRFSYLLKDGKTWLPFRPEMFDPDHLIREMDRKGIDVSILSMNTPSVYVFEPQKRIDLARGLNDSIVKRAKRNPDRVRGFATLPLPDVEASLIELERIKDAPGVVGIGVGSNFDGVALDDRSLEPVWARIAELGLPVSEHPMLPTFAEHLPGYALPIRVGFPFDTTLCVTRMIYGGVFERHPSSRSSSRTPDRPSSASWSGSTTASICSTNAASTSRSYRACSHARISTTTPARSRNRSSRWRSARSVSTASCSARTTPTSSPIRPISRRWIYRPSKSRRSSAAMRNGCLRNGLRSSLVRVLINPVL